MSFEVGQATLEAASAGLGKEHLHLQFPAFA